MTTEEAFVKVLQRHGIAYAFGIIGSAFMPVSDLFDRAGIKFWDVAHEGNGGIMCDGYTRSTGAIGMLIAQNGPGVTNFVTAVKTAYWNHTPMLLVTPQAANKTIGQGGFQEVEQMALFRDMVAYQEEVRDPSRVAEVLNRVINRAKRLSAPAQINIPRDVFTHVVDIELPAIVEFERPAGGAAAIAEAARLLSAAEFPVILSGAGVVLGGAIADAVALAERLDAPVANNYQHNDSFPGGHRLAAGPLGYNGSKAAMELVAKADVVLALGTRLNPFSTLPGYGLDYWPKAAKVIQVDINPDRIGLTRPVAVGICGDAKLVARAILAKSRADGRRRGARGAQGARPRAQVALAADAVEPRPRRRRPRHELERRRAPARRRAHVAAPGVARNPGRTAARRDHLERHRQQLRDRQRLSVVRRGAQISRAGAVRPVRLRLPRHRRSEDRQPGHALRRLRRRRRLRHLDERNELDRPRRLARRDDGRVPQLPMGAEKRNSILWYDDNFVGTELNPNLSYAKVARRAGSRASSRRRPPS